MDLTLFLVGLGLFIGFFLITVLFWDRERKTGRKVYYVKRATALGMLTGIANIMKAGPEVNPLGLSQDLLQLIVITSWSIVFITMGFFFLSMRHEAPPWKSVAAATLLLTTEIIMGIFALENPTIEGNVPHFIWKVCFALLGIYVFGYGSAVFVSAQRKRPETRSLILSIALLVIAVSYLPVIVGYDLTNYLGIEVFGGINIETLTDAVRIAMIAIIVIVLLSDLEYFYRIPSELYLISIVASSGVCLYTYHEKEVDVNDELLASALTAISMVVREASGSMRDLKRIETGDRAILVETRKELEMFVVALIERPSLLLVRSLKMFADLASQQLEGVSALEIDTALDDEELNKMVYRAFPFLRIE